jgi:hypothetical protein
MEVHLRVFLTSARVRVNSQPPVSYPPPELNSARYLPGFIHGAYLDAVKRTVILHLPGTEPQLCQVFSGH